MSNYSNKLYAIMNIETGKLETKLTNPGHKFWEVKGHCENALKNYNDKYIKQEAKMKVLKEPHPTKLKIVEFDLLLNNYIEE